MHSRRLVGALVPICLLASLGVAAASDDATRLRVFVTDGTSLVSYGELARVGDQVVFSMPTASTPDPPLHLVNIPADRVDWNRTNRYAAAARAAHYLKTQAPIDYLALSNEVAQALNAVALTTDASRRLDIVENARKRLAEWPQNHYNYRHVEVQQMLSMLDEAVFDLRAARGAQRFALTFFAFADQSALAEPLLPAPTPKEGIEQILTAAHVVSTPSDRRLLLSKALGNLDRDAPALPVVWCGRPRREPRPWRGSRKSCGSIALISRSPSG